MWVASCDLNLFSTRALLLLTIVTHLQLMLDEFRFGSALAHSLGTLTRITQRYVCVERLLVGNIPTRTSIVSVRQVTLQSCVATGTKARGASSDVLSMFSISVIIQSSKKGDGSSYIVVLLFS